jgi:hypothetical protein
MAGKTSFATGDLALRGPRIMPKTHKMHLSLSFAYTIFIMIIIIKMLELCIGYFFSERKQFFAYRR